jgi:hypothetical protein
MEGFISAFFVVQSSVPRDEECEMSITRSITFIDSTEFIESTELEPNRISANAPDADDVLALAATNPHADADMLEVLSKSDSAFVRSRVAQNEKTPSVVLDAFLHDCETVRVALAANPRAIERVWLLANDDSKVVRLSLAVNPFLPDHVYQVLGKDEDSEVSWQARRTLKKVRQSDNPVSSLLGWFKKAS